MERFLKVTDKEFTILSARLDGTFTIKDFFPTMRALISTEASHLRQEVKKLLSRTNEIQQAMGVPIQRKRRSPDEDSSHGLLPVGGRLLKWLFGTLDDKDYDRIMNKFAQLGQTNQKIIHLISEQASLIDVNGKNIAKNIKEIQALTNITDVMEKELERLAKFQMNTTEFLADLILSSSIVSTSARLLESAVARCQREITYLAHALDVTANGQLSNYILPPSELLKVLEDIASHLPSELSFVLPLRADTISHYYAYARVKSAAAPGHLRLLVEIPLKGANTYFELYRALPIPIRVENSSFSVLVSPKSEFLALSSNRQAFVGLNYEDLHDCFEGPERICAPRSAVLTHPHKTCEYSLLMGYAEDAERLCEKKVVRMSTPYFFRMDERGSWVYHADDPLTITVKCPTYGKWTTTGARYSSVTRTLHGTGISALGPACSAFAPGLILPSSYQGRQEYHFRLTNDTITFPAVGSVLTMADRRFLVKVSTNQTYKHLLDHLIEIDHMPSASTGISMDELKQRIQAVDEQANDFMESERWPVHLDYLQRVGFPITTIILVVVGIWVLWKWCYAPGRMGYMLAKRWRRNPRTEAFSEIEEANAPPAYNLYPCLPRRRPTPMPRGRIGDDDEDLQERPIIQESAFQTVEPRSSEINQNI